MNRYYCHVVVLGVGLLGALLGSFLPVPAYRLSVDWGKPSRTGCDRCGRSYRVGWRGWLRFGSSCPGCGAATGPAWALLALAAGTACAGLAWRFGATPTLLPYLGLALLGCLLAAVDLACHRLPERLVLPAIALSVLALGAVTLSDDRSGSWPRALAAGAVLAVSYLALALLPGGQLGFGDVTLAGLLGLYLGWLGWPTVLAGALLPFLVNAPVVLVLLALRRLRRRSAVPFGPAMLAGAFLALVGPHALALLLGR